MRKSILNRALLCSSILTGAFALAAHAYAQDVEEVPDAGEIAAGQSEDRIVVTGSRIRRDEFSSISPLQTLDADAGRAIGIFDAGALIQESPIISGPQFDNSIKAGGPTSAVEGVSQGGVGSNNIALRGLPAQSTLLLLNGRRLGRSGVRGAPIAPDLNLLPSSMIDRIEILTDGASSIYGSDAVAGVVNLILRDEYEGLEVSTNMSFPFKDGGRVNQVSFIGGASSDRGNFTIAAEYFDRDTVFVGQRPNYNDCLRDIEVTPSGDLASVCLDGRPDNAAFIGSAGFVYRTDAVPTDIGVPGWATRQAFSDPTSIFTGADQPYNLQDEERATQLFGGLERYNLFAAGKYDLDFFSRDTVYFEASFAQRNTDEHFTNEQVFPAIPHMIPQEDANGNIIVDGMGNPILVDNPLNPFDNERALPVFTTPLLAQNRVSDLNNFRFVLGFEGDVPFSGWFEEKGWTYDIYGTYDRSYGVAHQPTFDEPAIRESIDTLRIDSNGNLVCGLERTAGGFGFLTPRTCVPINFFSDTLFDVVGGNKTFATQAEADFIVGRSINTTEIESRVFQGVLTGDVFDLPGGTVAAAVGGEIRDEAINTVNDFQRVNGLAASENVDTEGNTVGKNSIWSIFAEFEAPITDWFNFNFSGRYSDDKIAGDNFTYSVKGALTPTEWLTARVTYGTTFRAPDLRALFLAGSVGTIGGANDPCVVPSIAQGPGDVYLPGMDPRSQQTLDNCFADGADPTALGLQALTAITTTTSGNVNLEPETSNTLTAGIILSIPPDTDFDFDFAITYFDIDVSDQILPTSATNVLTDCYVTQPNLSSPLCDFIERNTGDPSLATIRNVNVPFLNVATNTSRGLDFNARFGMDLDSLMNGARFSYNLAATYYIEQLFQIDPEDPTTLDDNVGEIGNPEWSGLGTALLDYENWTFRWRTRYLSGTETDADEIPAPNPAVNASACTILGITGPCTDFSRAGSRIYNDFSISYDYDSWSLTAGINNIFDKKPPLIDQGSGGPARMNIVVQSGYDLIGRRAFLTATKRF